jgi:hypothetical protein
VAKIIEFYIPNNFRRKVGWKSFLRRGQVIEFGSRIPTDERQLLASLLAASPAVETAPAGVERAEACPEASAAGNHP